MPRRRLDSAHSASPMSQLPMDPEELDRYLDYYRDHVRRDPENVEARLRLATVFREIGDDTRAIEHFEVASKLLTDRDLYLEAIAACKAVLQLAPERRSAQYLLAHLYARTPEVFEQSPRIAQPLETSDDEASEVSEPYRTDRDHLESDTVVTPAPGSGSEDEEPSSDRDEIEETVVTTTDEDLRETIDLAPEEQPEGGFSRDEMEELLTTIDVEPEDIIDIEELGNLEEFEDEHG